MKLHVISTIESFGGNSGDMTCWNPLLETRLNTLTGTFFFHLPYRLVSILDNLYECSVYFPPTKELIKCCTVAFLVVLFSPLLYLSTACQDDVHVRCILLFIFRPQDPAFSTDPGTTLFPQPGTPAPRFQLILF